MSGRGTVYSFTVVDDPPSERFEKYVPFVLALVQLEEGPMITAQLTDLDWKWENGIKKYNVEIGMPVEMVTRRLSEDGDKGLIDYGYKFRPPIRVDLQSGMIFKAQEAEAPVSY